MMFLFADQAFDQGGNELEISRFYTLCQLATSVFLWCPIHTVFHESYHL